MKRKVRVAQVVEVEIDESKFDEAFMAEFRESFFEFYTVDDHVEHLAQLYARGIADDFPSSFIEGYGRPPEMGIHFGDDDDGFDVEILSDTATPENGHG